jgi:hypothetical protein
MTGSLMNHPPLSVAPHLPEAQARATGPPTESASPAELHSEIGQRCFDVAQAHWKAARHLNEHNGPPLKIFNLITVSRRIEIWPDD